MLIKIKASDSASVVIPCHNTVPTLIGIVCCVEIVWLKFAEIKGAKIILLVKSPTFMAAELKDFTVRDDCIDISCCRSVETVKWLIKLH